MRKPWTIALLASFMLASVLAIGYVTGRSAEAQPATEVVVISEIPVIPVNGFANILLGEADGVISVNCEGNSGPGHALGGSVVPAVVLENLGPSVTALRVVSWPRTGALTPPVNNQQVFIGCVFEATVSAATQLRQLGSRWAHTRLLMTRVEFRCPMTTTGSWKSAQTLSSTCLTQGCSSSGS